MAGVERTEASLRSMCKFCGATGRLSFPYIGISFWLSNSGITNQVQHESRLNL